MVRTSRPHVRRSWTAERLRTSLAMFHRDESIVVLANREPLRHDYAPNGDVVVRRSGGGLVTALEPVIQACSGIWVAHGDGTADTVMVDDRDGLSVPPDNPMYRLRRVWLDAQEERGYYSGFANEGLWPLCHRTRVPPVFRARDFEMYEGVNARFAKAVCEEVNTSRPIVLVQDYHFALAPRAIRERLPHSTIVSFWHIPWPHPRDYAICPWGPQLLEGLLGSSIIGLQTSDDCQTTNPCVTPSCDTATGLCSFPAIADGTPTPGVAQLPGDCHVRQWQKALFMMRKAPFRHD